MVQLIDKKARESEYLELSINRTGCRWNTS